MLKAAGFTVHRMTFTEPGTADVENLYARIGTARAASVFAGHTDVVPPGDEARWTHPPFAGEIADGVLYGRGAVDMKGGDRLHGRGGARSSRRQRRQAEGLDLVPDHRRRGRHRGQRHRRSCCNGRPRAARNSTTACSASRATSTTLGDTIKIGRRGSLNGTLIVTGKQGHVAYPHRADNPIRGLVTLMRALHGRAARPGQRAISTRRTSSSPRSTSATRPST